MIDAHADGDVFLEWVAWHCTVQRRGWWSSAATPRSSPIHTQPVLSVALVIRVPGRGVYGCRDPVIYLYSIFFSTPPTVVAWIECIVYMYLYESAHTYIHKHTQSSHRHEHPARMQKSRGQARHLTLFRRPSPPHVDRGLAVDSLDLARRIDEAPAHPRTDCM